MFLSLTLLIFSFSFPCPSEQYLWPLVEFLAFAHLAIDFHPQSLLCEWFFTPCDCSPTASIFCDWITLSFLSIRVWKLYHELLADVDALLAYVYVPLSLLSFWVETNSVTHSLRTLCTPCTRSLKRTNSNLSTPHNDSYIQ